MWGGGTVEDRAMIVTPDLRYDYKYQKGRKEGEIDKWDDRKKKKKRNSDHSSQAPKLKLRFFAQVLATIRVSFG